jgi:hypothetical protein
MKVMTNLTSGYDYYHETMLSQPVASKSALPKKEKTD